MTGAGESGPPRDMDMLEYEALLTIYESARESCPDDIAVLYWLGHAYTRLGRLQAGLEVDICLSALLPRDPTVRYNLACSHALLDHTEEALAALEKAVRLGYTDGNHLQADEDLRSLREDPRFQRLIERLSSGG